MIVYLFCIFLSSGSQFRVPKWSCGLRLEPRNELEEMAPMVVMYPESTSFIASSHEDKAHLSILTTPRPLPHVRFADHRFLLDKAAFVAWEMNDSRCPLRQWTGS